MDYASNFIIMFYDTSANFKIQTMYFKLIFNLI